MPCFLLSALTSGIEPGPQSEHNHLPPERTSNDDRVGDGVHFYFQCTDQMRQCGDQLQGSKP